MALRLGKNSLAAGTTLFTTNGSAYVFELGDVPIVTEPLVVQLIQTASSGCSELGATIEVTATGGMEPYTYAMYDATNNSLIGSGVTNAFENVPMGTYYVQVTDSNSIQERSNSVSITESEAITATVKVNDISCENNDDGSISIEASGGIAPLKYSIGDGAFYFQPNFENLTSGNYDITIQDANGCAFHTS
ncbi:SprB repeat-containing protein [Zobellia laminariae]|uniref:SprB repeat-containing protein n=1 Tax=Zobellia laminariae TaxID=248906 RepID=UPI0026F422B5|nr:SprB repeat-containing protein [Zobellia laminariae]WKX76299.1 SprB repeat-containing protein [Zobellia laminariae]